MPYGDLEQRVAALEAQAGVGQTGGGGGGGQPGGVGLQAFLQGALAAHAASQQQAEAQGLPTEGGSAAGGGGIFGWNPTKYDSFWWCQSRFMCNPQSVSCLC
jgi:hypothetical protein